MVILNILFLINLANKNYYFLMLFYRNPNSQWYLARHGPPVQQRPYGANLLTGSQTFFFFKSNNIHTGWKKDKKLVTVIFLFHQTQQPKSKRPSVVGRSLWSSRAGARGCRWRWSSSFRKDRSHSPFNGTLGKRFGPASKPPIVGTERHRAWAFDII